MSLGHDGVMGTYVSVRGWLECDDKQVPLIRAVIAAHDDDGSYSRGWVVPPHPVGWRNRIFYGADIRESWVEWILEQLREIAAVPASDADEDRVVGLFLVDHDVDGLSEWQVRDGEVFIGPGDPRFRYLDA